MQNKPLTPLVDIKLKLLFWSTAVSIPVISYTGRRLQHWLEATLTKEQTGLLVTVLLLITALIYILRFIRNWKRLWWRFLVIVILLLIIFQLVPINEERVHFILFSVLGYLATTLFSFLSGLFFCIFFSVGDEIFQWFLPDRVGDPRDVLFNLAASSIGIILAFSEKKTK